MEHRIFGHQKIIVMQPYFITSSGTNVGKTMVTCTLCWQLRHTGKKVTALKPIISGFNPADMSNDTARILKSCGLTPTPEMVAAISPWRYAPELAPNMAAALENKPAPLLDEVVGFCREHESVKTDILLVEGVGGVMVPLNQEHTVLDWMQTLGWPVILVVGSYLGSISHTLTALEVLKARGLAVAAMIVSESHQSNVSLADTVATLEQFVSKDIPVLKMPRAIESDEIWKSQPLISWICSHEG